MKQAVQKAPVLQLADPAKPYVVTCDASDVGIGAVLEQEDADGCHPIAFASRKLSGAEQNYPVHERELLAIVYALKEWRTYLHGSRFVIRTDHHPLRYLDSQSSLSKRQMRWMEVLQEYDYSIQYVKGKYNVVADALSRVVVGEERQELYTGEQNEEDVLNVNTMGTISRPIVTPKLIKEFVQAYESDESLAQLYAEPPEGQYEKNEDGLLMDISSEGRKLVVPQGKLRQTIMHDAHDSIVSGHLGFNKAIERIRQSFIWPNMYSEVKSYVRSCDSCQRNKSSSQKPIGLLQPLEVPTVRFEEISMDFIMSLPRTHAGNDAIFVIVDRLTKLVSFIPTTSDVDAVGAAKLFFNHWYRWFGLPRKIVSDRDGRFVSRFWRELFRLVQTRLAMSTSHHPQTDGQTEKTNRTLEEMARHYVNYQQTNWDEVLPGLEHAYNSSVHAATGESPFMLAYGQNPQSLSGMLVEPSTTAVESVGEFLSRMQSLVEKAMGAITSANESAEKYANRSRRDFEFGVGDEVLLSTKFFVPAAYRDKKRKFAPKYAGPYEVVQVISPVAYRLKLPEGTKAHNVFHSSMLKKYHPDSTQVRHVNPPEPVILEGQEEEYEVERIISHRLRRGKPEYLVKWRGYPLSDCTWEPTVNLSHCAEAIESFHEETSRPTS